jgi:hypothetical protein
MPVPDGTTPETTLAATPEATASPAAPTPSPSPTRTMIAPALTNKTKAHKPQKPVPTESDSASKTDDTQIATGAAAAAIDTTGLPPSSGSDSGTAPAATAPNPAPPAASLEDAPPAQAPAESPKRAGFASWILAGLAVLGVVAVLRRVAGRREDTRLSIVDRTALPDSEPPFIPAHRS